MLRKRSNVLLRSLLVTLLMGAGLVGCSLDDNGLNNGSETELTIAPEVEGLEGYVGVLGKTFYVPITAKSLKNIEIQVGQEWHATLEEEGGKTLLRIVAPEAGNEVYKETDLKIFGTSKKGQVFMATTKLSAVVTDFRDPKGTWALYEGNFGTNGSITFVDAEGKAFTQLFKKVNGHALGQIVQDMYIHNGRLYILAQQGKGTGTAGEDQLVVCDARSLKKIYATNLEYKTPKDVTIWPQHIVVTSDQQAFVQFSSSDYEKTSGVLELSLGKKGASVKQLVEGSFGDFSKGGALKDRMVFSRGRIYLGLGEAVGIIQPGANPKLTRLDITEGRQVKGVTKAKDGRLFVLCAGHYTGKNNDYSNPAQLTDKPIILEINHEGKVLKKTEVPEGITFGVHTWQPSVGLTTAFTQPHLYFRSTEGKLVQFNFETNTFNPEYVTIPAGKSLYGILGVQPQTENLWYGLNQSYTKMFLHHVDTKGATPKEVGTVIESEGVSEYSLAGFDFSYRYSSEWTGK